MTNPVYTELYRDHIIKVYWDDTEAFNPREDDNLGSMYIDLRRYSMGDQDLDLPDFSECRSWDEVEQVLRRELDIAVLLPLYAYIHSGVDISTQVETSWYHYSWDGGRAGFIFCTRQDIRDWYGVKRVTRNILEKAEEALRQEVQTYRLWNAGWVFEWVVKDEAGEEIDTIGGYISGSETADFILADARGTVDVNIENRNKTPQEIGQELASLEW